MDEGALGWPAITPQAEVVGSGAEEFCGSVTAGMSQATPFEEAVDVGIGVHGGVIYLDQQTR